MASRNFFKTVRVTILLVVLFFVGMNSWLTQLRTTDWDDTLWVAVYPINGDGSAATQSYIDRLSRDSFESVETFLSTESERYGVSVNTPVTLRLAPQINEKPPAPPANPGTFSIMLWSLKLRYWAWRNDSFDGPQPDVQMYVVYHDPNLSNRVAHSLGLQKGMIGVVNAFAAADLTERNNVVIAHEFLHTVGASDKYDLSNNLPIYPDGYADPQRSPRFPQTHAEVMGGRVPVSELSATMPKSLRLCRIGDATAREIRWLD
ncbi:MAG: hypothetical protein RQ736_15000 [Thiogranum sp.]|nr:hypothetical protein [Thiogranum sp.]